MAAATQTLPALISMEEYLHSSYHPDCDYVDGVLEERNMGDSEHSDVQTEILFWFRSRKNDWNIRVNGELRARVSETRCRVPDVCVRLLDAPREKVLTTPPLIAIEVLSPDDRFPRVVVRLREFLDMGVRHIWLIDPVAREAYTFDATGLHIFGGTRLAVPNSPIYLDLTDIFSALE